MRHLVYLALLAGCLIGTAPLELLLHTRVYVRWRRLVLALLPTLIVFTAWDLYAIGQQQWRYERRWTTGLLLLGRLPLEELLFFVVIPTCAILTLEAVRRRRPEWAIGDEPSSSTDGACRGARPEPADRKETRQ
jgi:lycopene cyclase domain-containing protein